MIRFVGRLCPQKKSAIRDGNRCGSGGDEMRKPVRWRDFIPSNLSRSLACLGEKAFAVLRLPNG